MNWPKRERDEKGMICHIREIDTLIFWLFQWHSINNINILETHDFEVPFELLRGDWCKKGYYKDGMYFLCAIFIQSYLPRLIDHILLAIPWVVCPNSTDDRTTKTHGPLVCDDLIIETARNFCCIFVECTNKCYVYQHIFRYSTRVWVIDMHEMRNEFLYERLCVFNDLIECLVSILEFCIPTTTRYNYIGGSHLPMYGSKWNMLETPFNQIFQR